MTAINGMKPGAKRWRNRGKATPQFSRRQLGKTATLRAFLTDSSGGNHYSIQGIYESTGSSPAAVIDSEAKSARNSHYAT